MRDEHRILIIKEGDMLVAQCLEYDVCTQAPSFAELQRRMDTLMELEARLGLKEAGAEYGHLGPAPKHFHDMWDSALPFEASRTGRKMAMAKR